MRGFYRMVVRGGWRVALMTGCLAVLWAALPLLAAAREDDNLRMFVAKRYPKMEMVGHFGFGPGQFKAPCAVALSPRGRLAVSDTESFDVTIFDQQLQPVMVIDRRGGEAVTTSRVELADAAPDLYGDKTKAERKARPEHGIDNPFGLAFDSKGNLHILEERESRILKVSPEGKLLGTFGGPGAGPGKFRFPRGLDIDSHDQIYVADYENFRIQVLDATFRYVREIKWKNPKGQVGAPGDVAVDPQGRVWGLYTNLNVAVRFDREGKPQLEVGGTEKDDVTRMLGPKYISCDSEGEVYVADFWHHRVLHFDEAGEYLNSYGYKGNNRGQFKRPQGLAISPSGDLYVADTDNFRVQILQIDPLLGDFNEAEQLFRKNLMKQAMTRYEKVLVLNPYHERARRRVVALAGHFAEEAQRKGDLAAAREALETIFKYEPSNVQARKFQRWILWRENKGWIYHLTLGIGIFLTFIFLVSAMVKMLMNQ